MLEWKNAGRYPAYLGKKLGTIYLPKVVIKGGPEKYVKLMLDKKPNLKEFETMLKGLAVNEIDKKNGFWVKAYNYLKNQEKRKTK